MQFISILKPFHVDVAFVENPYTIGLVDKWFGSKIACEHLSFVKDVSARESTFNFPMNEKSCGHSNNQRHT